MRCGFKLNTLLDVFSKNFIVWLVFFVFLSLLFHYDGFGFYISDGLVDVHSQGEICSRVMKSSRDGLLSEAGLLGWYDLGETHKTRVSCEDYSSAKIDYSEYELYLSEPGGQGLLFSIIYLFYKDLCVFERVVAVLLAIVLVSWFMWVSRVFGLYTSIITLVGVAMLRYLVMVGNNIDLFLPSIFIVLSGLLWALELNTRHLGKTAFILLLTKYLFSGAEFVFPVIIMMYLPVIFYALLRRRGFKDTVHKIKTVSLAIIMATSIAAAILFTQISIAKSPEEALEHFYYRLNERTVCTKISPKGWMYCKRLTVDSIKDSFGIYLKKPLIMFEWISVTAAELILFFILVTLLSLLFHIHYESDRRLYALLVTSWFSLASPLSYFIITHGHAYNPLHDDWTPVVWGIPFALFAILLAVRTLMGYYFFVVDKAVSGRASGG